MEDELLEGGPSLGDDEESDGRAPGDKGFLDRTSTSDELLVGPERLRRWQRRRTRRPAVAMLEGRALVRAPTFMPRAERSIPTWAASAGRASERSPTGRRDPPRAVARTITGRTVVRTVGGA